MAETGEDINIIPNFLEEFNIMTDAQVFIALVIALIPGILAIRLSTELYK